MNRSRGFIPILILIIVVIVGAVLLLGKNKLRSVVTVGSPVASVTSDPLVWKVYSSQDGTFSFRYPQELAYIYEGADNPQSSPLILGGVTMQNYDGSKSGPDLNSLFQFSVLVIANNSQGLGGIPSNVQDSSKSEYKVDGYNGTLLVSDVYSNKPIVRVEYKNKIYIFQMSPADSLYKNWFDQILSTFKFTN